MSSVVISGDTSGAITLAAPAVAGTNTLTLQAGTATNSMNTLATAVASTSGTSIDFTSIPSWVKRITVMFTGVSTNGISSPIIQIGSGSFETSGYLGSGVNLDTVVSSALLTTGYRIGGGTNASVILHGFAVVQLVTASTWCMSASFARSESAGMFLGAGSKAISGTLDRVRITTVNGTDTFDAGSINILYEG
jgi:hypothetical protein